MQSQRSTGEAGSPPELRKKVFDPKKEASPMAQIEETSQSWDVGKK